MGVNLHELFKIMGYANKQNLDTDLRNNNSFPWDPKEHHIQQRILNTYKDFFYTTGRFPGNIRLISIPRGRIPSFINSTDTISPLSLYEKYVGRDMQGVVGVQFLAALNRFLGGDAELSRNAMCEFFHNLSWQVLTNDNDSIILEFDAFGTLIQSINSTLMNEIHREKLEQLKRGKEVIDMISQNFTDITQTPQEMVEQNMVEDLINNDQTNYQPYFHIPVVKTEEEIDDARIRENTDFLEGELAKNARDFEFAAELEARDRTDLIRNATDPGYRIMAKEDIAPLDHNKTERNEPAAPQLDPAALRGMETFLGKLTEIIVAEDDTPEIKQVPEAVYTAPEIVRSDLQDLLTRDNQDISVLDDIKSVGDKIKIEIEDVVKTGSPIFDGEFDATEFSPRETPPPPYIGPPYIDLSNKKIIKVKDEPDPPRYTQIDLSDNESIKVEDPPDPRQIYALVPPEISIDSDDDIGEIIGNPNVNTILPPLEGEGEKTPPVMRKDLKTLAIQMMILTLQ